MSSRSHFEESRSGIKVGDRGVVFLSPVMDEAALKVYPEVLRGVVSKRGYAPLTDYDGRIMAKKLWDARPKGAKCIYILSTDNNVTQISESGAVQHQGVFIEVCNSTSFAFMRS